MPWPCVLHDPPPLSPQQAVYECDKHKLCVSLLALRVNLFVHLPQISFTIPTHTHTHPINAAEVAAAASSLTVHLNDLLFCFYKSSLLRLGSIFILWKPGPMTASHSFSGEGLLCCHVPLAENKFNLQIQECSYTTGGNCTRLNFMHTCPDAIQLQIPRTTGPLEPSCR